MRENFAEPTREFERLVIGGGLRHPGHPVLTWMAQHVHVKHDVNNNKRPVKPADDDHRKIDGITAAVMALARAMLGQPGVSIYETQGLTIIGQEEAAPTVAAPAGWLLDDDDDRW
jgi:phage terminase large subunit-like protein